MASIYNRPDSPFIWIRYKDGAGKWKAANTGYRQDNLGDRKQAEIVAERKGVYLHPRKRCIRLVGRESARLDLQKPNGAIMRDEPQKALLSESANRNSYTRHICSYHPLVLMH